MKKEQENYNKDNQILHYFNKSFNDICKYNCKEQYDHLNACFKNNSTQYCNNNQSMNQTNMALPIPMSNVVNKLNTNKSFDKTNACFDEATSYFICLINESSKFDDL